MTSIADAFENEGPSEEEIKELEQELEEEETAEEDEQLQWKKEPTHSKIFCSIAR